MFPFLPHSHPPRKVKPYQDILPTIERESTWSSAEVEMSLTSFGLKPPSLKRGRHSNFIT